MLQQNEKELEQQWVNLATTGVIAHYNAAVELEFMSKWQEALVEYEHAQKLASVAMKSNNPMTMKIKQATQKIRIKVRNKVQLPSKLPLQEKSKHEKSSIGGKKSSYQTSQLKSSHFGNRNTNTVNSVLPSSNDFQNSMYSVKTNN